MSDTIPAKRPALIALLWAYCGAAILVGLIAVAGGILVIAFGEVIDPNEDEEVWYVVGGLVALLGAAGVILHVIPMFLPRDKTSWTVINGLLIAYLVFWVVCFQPLIAIPAILLSKWSKAEVRAYYGVAIEAEHPGHWKDDWDDGWDDSWDRPRRR